MSATVTQVPTDDKPAGRARDVGAPPRNVIVNGDFSSGPDGWAVDIQGGGEGRGSITVDNGRALLQDGSQLLKSLGQWFTVRASGCRVCFELVADAAPREGATRRSDTFKNGLPADGNCLLVPFSATQAQLFLKLQGPVT